MGFWPIVENVIRNADILLLVLDARMPDMSRNKEVEKKIAMLGKPVIFVFNKIDLASEEQIKYLKSSYKEGFIVSATKNLGIAQLRRELHILSKKLRMENPKIGVVGYPNIGKSAIINVLARRARTVVTAKPGTTRGVQWVNSGKFRLLDTPGVIPYEDKTGKLVLIGSKSADDIANPDKVASDIIQMFVSKNKKNLEERYKISIPPAMDHEDILIEIGRKRGFLSKGGIVDERKTSIQIIRDWQKGKLRL